MQHLHPWDCRVQAEGLRSYPLEDVVHALGYRRDPEDDARWRSLESVVSINGFMFYDHLCGEWGAGAVDLVVHVHRCSVSDALAFLSELRGHSRRMAHRLCPRVPNPPKPARSQRQWCAVERHLVDQRGISPVLIALCRDLGLLYADRQGNAVFLCRNAAGEETGTEIVPIGGQSSGAGTAAEPAPSPLTPGSFWMSWGAGWPPSVLIAKSAIDALSALSLQLVPVKREGCTVVSAGAVSATIPSWIEAWNPRRIFCAYDATPDGEDAAQRLLRNDNTGSSASAPPSTVTTGTTCSCETAPANHSEPTTGDSTEWAKPQKLNTPGQKGATPGIPATQAQPRPNTYQCTALGRSAQLPNFGKYVRF